MTAFAMRANLGNKPSPLSKQLDIMTSKPMELIHMNLFGLTKTKSLSENRFVFVDDFSRFIWVFFLEHKD